MVLVVKYNVWWLFKSGIRRWDNVTHCNDVTGSASRYADVIKYPVDQSEHICIYTISQTYIYLGKPAKHNGLNDTRFSTSVIHFCMNTRANQISLLEGCIYSYPKFLLSVDKFPSPRDNIVCPSYTAFANVYILQNGISKHRIALYMMVYRYNISMRRWRLYSFMVILTTPRGLLRTNLNNNQFRDGKQLTNPQGTGVDEHLKPTTKLSPPFHNALIFLSI